MLIEHRGKRPTVHESAYIAPTAVVSGEVTVGAGARIMHGAVVTAEDGPVSLGDNVVVMENAVIRGRAGYPALVGNSVMIGPHAHVNGATIGAAAFIATGAALFPGSVIGKRSEVRVNAVVQIRSRLHDGAVVPIGWVAVGDPAQILSPDRHDEIWVIQRGLNFLSTVYGVSRDESMREVMSQQSDYYGAHLNDRVIDSEAD
jgi:carbonic anhydrase/acetyltransferase-like protein (isoleucine patch superfamily)